MWLKRCSLWALIVAWSLSASPSSAEVATAGDPCAATIKTTSSAPSVRSRIQIERDTAIYIAKHAQRACHLIDGLADQYGAQNDQRRAAEFRAVIDILREDVLEPIYREYPDLRGQDLMSAHNQEDERAASQGKKPDLAAQARTMGPATAIYLRWMLDVDALRSLSSVFMPKACDWAQSEKCVAAIMDATAEIGFASAPTYRSYPDLSRLAMKESEALAASQKRTPAIDAAFRKAAPPRGSVRLTSAAASFIRDFLDAGRRQGASSCQVVAISWEKSES